MGCSQFSSTVGSTCIYQAIRDEILTPLIYLLFAAALVYFIFGVVRYLLAERRGDDSEGKAKGRKHMLYGALGMAIMISVFGIMQFIWSSITSFGLTQGVTGQTVTAPQEINGL